MSGDLYSKLVEVKPLLAIIVKNLPYVAVFRIVDAIIKRQLLPIRSNNALTVAISGSNSESS